MEKNSKIILTIENEVATVLISNPSKLNALSYSLLQDLEKKLDDLKQSSAKLIIFKGEGSKAFVAGADIKEMVSFTPQQAYEYIKYGQKVFTKVSKLSIPTIAVIQGFALGGGAELALACDFRIVNSDALFGFPEVQLGIIPGFGGTQRLTQLIGYSKSLEIILTSKRLSGEEMLSYGIANEFVKNGESMDDVIDKWVSSILKAAPIAVKMAKQAVQASETSSLESGLVIELMCETVCFSTSDCKIGFESFLERKQPEFKGE